MLLFLEFCPDFSQIPDFGNLGYEISGESFGLKSIEYS
jgi:hypothetical protein